MYVNTLVALFSTLNESKQLSSYKCYPDLYAYTKWLNSNQQYKRSENFNDDHRIEVNHNIVYIN